ncbi:transposon-encoded TnpW family protein [Ruminococcaceae bacterium OttesenSCG-928-L11]|nr:transposon-encoded TnpW family protein [Ruminococcaceae bacterium OttesenSCG-928-L11]
MFTRRIGSTTYTVGVHFSSTSRDTMDDKIVRLVRREAEGK